VLNETSDEYKKEQLIRRYCNTYHLEEKNINYDMIIKHWNLERKLQKEMLKCERSRRVDFFMDCYNILYTSCHWLVSTGIADNNQSASKNWFISNNLPKNAQILEIGGGAGNCAKTVSEKGFSLTCIDISEERVAEAKKNNQNSNIAFRVGDATNLQLLNDSFDIVDSHEMIEHLHPDDVLYHLKEVYKILKEGGFYYFTTPNGLWGPQDVSRVFECKKAYGMHLKEYSYSEISPLLQDSGFTTVQSPAIHPSVCYRARLIPPLVDSSKKSSWESTVRSLPYPLNRYLATLTATNSVMIKAIK
jgi:2-polyprenyl-3-methyl-5-hydroxy-6-metoxy-1,4-benzoquinol methylase